MAETTQNADGSITKVLDLPYGIGRTEVKLEGMTDGIKRKAAFESYGTYIRGLVHERTDDGAIQARAEEAAARAKQADSRDGSPIYTGQAELGPNPGDVAGPVPPHEGAIGDYAGLGATLIAQRTSLAARVGRAEADLATWRRELKALNAACEALEEDDAPTDAETAHRSTPSEVEQD